MGSNDSKYLIQILRIPAVVRFRLFGAAASQGRRLHTGGKASGSLSPRDVFSPWSLILEKPTSAHMGKRHGWPWVWSHLPGPSARPRSRHPCPPKWDGASPPAPRPRLLDLVLVFGCRQVYIPPKRPTQASSKLVKSTIIISLDLGLQFLRPPRGAQAAAEAGAGCHPAPWQPLLPHFCYPRLASSTQAPPPTSTMFPPPASPSRAMSPAVARFLHFLGLGPLPKWRQRCQLWTSQKHRKKSGCAAGGPSAWCGVRWRRTTVRPKSARNDLEPGTKKIPLFGCFHPGGWNNNRGLTTHVVSVARTGPT